MKGIISRLAVGVGVVATLVAICVIPASAQATPQGPVLMVGAPTEGAQYPRGRTYFSGVAYDPSGQTSQYAPAGVDRVQAFAGPRDGSGTWLGTASKLSVTGVPLSQCLSGNCIGDNGKQQDPAVSGPLGIAAGGGVANSGWSIKTYRSLRVWMSGTFYFYARSAVTGMETVVQVANIKVDPGRANGKVQP
jgi:hypothetical protein